MTIRMRGARAGGFTLLEVMITLFVIGVGLLSVAGLQTLSKKSNFDAMQRTIAAALAQDLIERIRTNPSQGAGYLTDPVSGISGANAPAAPGVDCNTANSSAPACTPSQVVSFDLYQWSRALFGLVESVTTGSGASASTIYTGGLSEPTACIVNPSAPCGIYTVTIVWRGITPVAQATSADAGTAVATSCGTGPNNPYVPPSPADSGKTMRRVMVVQTVIDDHMNTCASPSVR